MALSRKRASGHMRLTTSLDRFMSQFIHSAVFFPSVDAEGGVVLVTLAGEISNQLTITDHQEQAATYGTTKTVNIF